VSTMKLTGKTQTQVDNERTLQELKQEEQSLLKYLSETDWYVNRFTESKTKIPEEVKNERSAARDRISEIRLIFQSK